MHGGEGITEDRKETQRRSGEHEVQSFAALCDLLLRDSQKIAKERKEDLVNMRPSPLRVFASFCGEGPDRNVFNRRSQRSAKKSGEHEAQSFACLCALL